jgi:putative NADH-flavin reductase
MVTPGRPATIAVLGAGGRLGRHVVGDALARGHTVHAAIHRSNPLSVHPRLQILSADAHRADMIRAVLSDTRLVISCLGSAAAHPPDVQGAGARNLVTAMEALGLLRLVSVTGSGARIPGERLTRNHRIKRQQMLSGAPRLLADGDEHLATIAASDLTWTIIRVPLMILHHRANQYTIQQEAPNPAANTTYRDAARAMLDLATEDNPAWTRTAPFVTSGEPLAMWGLSASPSPGRNVHPDGPHRSGSRAWLGD